jgi:hypothetical protein
MAVENAARKAYLNDVHKQAAVIAAHGDKLKKKASGRIAKADAALKRYRDKTGADTSDPLQHTHAVSRLLHEVAFYPPHDVRKESPDYKKSHDDMVRVKDLPCLACGVRNSTLKDPKQNPFGAVQMETHHHVIEWALANAIDPGKFNSHVLPGLLRKNPDKYATMKTGMTKEQILAWVDHDEDNLWVLCDVHHRHTFVGIHAITFPIWGPQDILDAELVQAYLDQAKKKDTKPAAAKPVRKAVKKTAKKKAAKKTVRKSVKQRGQ